jgi:hypothetical protein
MRNLNKLTETQMIDLAYQGKSIPMSIHNSKRRYDINQRLRPYNLQLVKVNDNYKLA